MDSIKTENLDHIRPLLFRTTPNVLPSGFSLFGNETVAKVINIRSDESQSDSTTRNRRG